MNICKESLLLQGDNIYLRPLLTDDITVDYINGLNDPEVNKYLVNVRQTVQTYSTVEKYVQSSMQDPHAILFGIFFKNNSKPLIGTVHVSHIDFFHFIASIGICLFSKRVWNKGYAVKALIIVKEYLFGTIGLHYLEGGVYAENTNSIKLFTRAGFSEMYRLNNKFRYVDSFKEAIYFGVINPLFDISLLKQNNLMD